MRVLEIRSNSIKVKTINGDMLVARYDDKHGTFFFNEEIEKEYVVFGGLNKEIQEEKEGLNEYCFNVEYAHKGIERGWKQKNTKVKAKSYEEAVEKVKKNFKTIYEISEI